MAEIKKAKLTTPEIRFWLDEAKSCEDRQDRELKKKNNYPFIRKYYEGVIRRKDDDTSVVTREKFAIINEHFPNTNALISEILFKNPDFLLEETKPFAVMLGPDGQPITDEEGQPMEIDVAKEAPFMKSAITYANRKTQSLIEYRVALFDMLYAGYGCIDINHARGTKTDKIANLPNEEELKVREEGAIGKFFNKIKGRAKDTGEAETNLEKSITPKDERKATPDKTYIIRREPLDILFDWRAKRLRDRRYDLMKVHMSKSEFDATYPHLADRVSAAHDIEFQHHTLDKDAKAVLLYEFQIRVRDDEYWTLILNPTLTDSEVDFFKRPYTTNGFNRKIGTLDKYGTIYPIARAQINKELSDERNEYINHMKEVAERSVPKLVADKDKVDSEAEEAVQSKRVRDIAYVNGNPQNAFWPLPETPVARENKELLGIYADQNQKQWGVSAEKVGGRTDSDFATELQIQEAGFEKQNVSTQEGLRMLYNEVNETLKDIIAELWDQEVYFKVTGGLKPQWYTPIVKGGRVINPLSEMLTNDYHVVTDISTALRPNKQREAVEQLNFLKQLDALTTMMAMQNKMINIEEISRISKQFGFNPETLLIEITPEAIQRLQASAGVNQ